MKMHLIGEIVDTKEKILRTHIALFDKIKMSNK